MNSITRATVRTTSFQALAALVAVALSVSELAAQAGLLADIRPGAVDPSPHSDPTGFVQNGSRVFFTASDAVHGRELWVVDTATVPPRPTLLADLAPGRTDALRSFDRLVAFRSGVAFRATTSPSGTGGIYFSDGTPAGTFPLIEGVVVDDLVNRFLISDGARLWFLAQRPDVGRELFVRDGTPAGTRLVVDLNPGPADGLSALGFLVSDGSSCWFGGDDGVHGDELWITDGTTAGTRLVADVEPGVAAARVRGIGMIGNELLFHAVGASFGRGSNGLWISDGTALGTRRLFVGDVVATEAVPLGRGWVFVAREAITGEEPWVTDGTLQGTRPLGDLRVSVEGSGVRDLVQWQGEVWFSADDGIHGRELFRTDGTPGNTRLALDVEPGPVSGVGTRLWPVGNLLVFGRADRFGVVDIWAVDPSGSSAFELVDPPRSRDGLNDEWLAFAGLVGLGQNLWFGANHAVAGREIWSTDGTTNGTRLLFDVAQSVPGSDPGEVLVDTGLRSWFLADDGVHGREPWITDGTAAGTSLWADLTPGPAGSELAATVAGDRVYWVGGAELFSTDLLGGDRQVLVSGGAFGGEIAVAGDRLFFARPHELWSTDLGTGSVQRIHVFPPVRSPQPWNFVATDHELYFLADGGSNGGGPGVWFSDGTAAGARRVLEVYMPPLPFDPDRFAMVRLGRSAVLVHAETLGNNWYELLRLDAGAPTRLTAYRGINGPLELEPMGDRVWFNLSADSFGDQLWTTDGTVAGLSRIATFPRLGGTASGRPEQLTAAGDRLFFVRDDGISGRELWVSDGTAAGTRLTRDLLPGPLASDPSGLVALGSSAQIVFAANGEQGRELFRSDGTTAGTVLAVDTVAGPASAEALPVGIVAASLLFHALDPAVGREPRAVPLAALAAPWLVRSFGGGCSGGAGRDRPELATAGTPTLGDARFALTLDHAAPNAASALLIDPGVRLFSPSGCGLWLAGAVVNVPRSTGGQGAAQLGLPVPTDPALVGLLLHAQWLVADTGGGLLGQASASNALQVVVGR